LGEAVTERAIAGVPAFPGQLGGPSVQPHRGQRLKDGIDHLVALSTHNGDHAAAGARSAQSMSTSMLLIISPIALLMAAGLALIITRSVTRPLP
jgi:hypothetical protein